MDIREIFISGIVTIITTAIGAGLAFRFNSVIQKRQQYKNYLEESRELLIKENTLFHSKVRTVNNNRRKFSLFYKWIVEENLFYEQGNISRVIELSGFLTESLKDICIFIEDSQIVHYKYLIDNSKYTELFEEHECFQIELDKIIKSFIASPLHYSICGKDIETEEKEKYIKELSTFNEKLDEILVDLSESYSNLISFIIYMLKK